MKPLEVRELAKDHGNPEVSDQYKACNYKARLLLVKNLLVLVFRVSRWLAVLIDLDLLSKAATKMFDSLMLFKMISWVTKHISCTIPLRGMLGKGIINSCYCSRSYNRSFVF